MPDDRPELRDVPVTWPVLATQDLHRDDWVMALRSDTVRRTPEEEPFTRLVLEHPGAAIILAVDEQERVFCLWQYRHPAGRRFVELPAGLCDGDDGESPLDVARRELREEALLEADEWTHLTSVWSSPGIIAEVQHLYLARGLRAVDRGDFVLRHEEADMDTAWVPFDELLEAVLAGRVTDAPLVTAILMAQARGLVPSDRSTSRGDAR
ncbi:MULTISPECIES: NUDIX hydrolase [unclassified Nocardioides]|uniref:NUDIX hydrolase n=1 Tax=unclassified Nocardioides TaxID=2615069 RepID=UPI0030153A92